MSVDIDIEKVEVGRGWEGIGASFEVRRELWDAFLKMRAHHPLFCLNHMDC
jgi:hypothetical protein